MRAITYETYGPAADVLTLVDVPEVAPEAGEVQVRLAFSAINPSDVKRRAGTRPGAGTGPFPPVCPHSEGAGTIIAVGPGVDPARIGEAVWIWNGQFNRDWGTAAEFITLPSEQAVALPAGVSLETGASLGIVGLTAAHTVFGDGPVAGKTLLIHGANGSVGHLAVQLAKWGGARVICTASPAGFARCRAAGAESVFDYRAPDLAQNLLEATDGQPFSRVIDVEFGQNIETNAKVIAENGTLAVYGSAKSMVPQVPFGPLLFKAVTIRIVLIYILKPQERELAIEKLHAALSENALSCPVDQVFSLAQAAQAHLAVEGGHREGAVLIDVTR